MRKNWHGAGFDALILTFVRIVTMLISMVTFKVLAVTFSLEEYGTYASAILVSTTTISLTILGLTDAVNYFYVKELDSEKGKVYVYTIFCMQYVIGVAAGILLICFKNPIAAYFKNPSVASLIPGVAFIPLLTNVSNMLQVLFVTAKKAKVIAIRNLIISALKIVLVTVACALLKNISAVIFITLALDFASVVYMLIYCKRHIFFIDILKANRSLVREILTYSIPMAAYVLTNTLSKNMDKLVIGAMGTSEMVGIYSIASKELPFDILTASFLTVLVPYITRYVRKMDFKNAVTAFSDYIQITYIVTWIIAGGAIVCSKELMMILYDEKYLPGLPVFGLYILVDMIKFASVSLIFSSLNKAKELLCYSGIALLLNAVLNIIFFKFWGILGPAIATVVVTLLLSGVITIRNAQMLHTKVSVLLRTKQLVCIGIECVLMGVISYMVKMTLAGRVNVVLLFAISYGVFVIPLIVINRKKILFLLKEINNAKFV